MIFYQLNINSKLNNFEHTVYIYSLVGKLIYQSEITEATSNINPPNIQPGVYIVKVYSETSSTTTKLIVN